MSTIQRATSGEIMAQSIGYFLATHNFTAEDRQEIETAVRKSVYAGTPLVTVGRLFVRGNLINHEAISASKASILSVLASYELKVCEMIVPASKEELELYKKLSIFSIHPFFSAGAVKNMQKFIEADDTTLYDFMEMLKHKNSSGKLYFKSILNSYNLGATFWELGIVA